MPRRFRTAVAAPFAPVLLCLLLLLLAASDLRAQSGVTRTRSCASLLSARRKLPSVTAATCGSWIAAAVTRAA